MNTSHSSILPLYIIQIKEAGMWFPCTDKTSDLEDALMLASSYCRSHHEDSVRILCPDGSVI
jgi:hypothetical protein